MNDNGTFSYVFSTDEIKALVRILRKGEAELPDCLENLKARLQDCIYNSMTIDEAENFFNENLS